ncbi:MAG: flagellar basal-body rod protein FlgG [Phycisphaerae bacterium]|nr:flagellar basal-body rod protein FlgG [Phycisphaerae bacterium]
MAILALHSAASGMKALDTALDVAANNLANVNTVGFKASRVNFEDLLYQIRREPGVLNAENEPIPHGIQVGLGVAVSGTQLNFEHGSVDPTANPLDMMIEGEGFFKLTVIENGDPIVAYTRAGNFSQNSEGTIVLGTTEGAVLDPPIQVPPGSRDITVTRDGQVRVIAQGSTTPTTVGQIELARFVNPEGLKQIGQNLYAETAASGTPVTGSPQQDGLGSIQNNFLEMSNVDPVRELIALIRTQRAFELNSQSVQSANQALQTVANMLRR